MKWFGRKWEASICQDLEQVAIPIEEKCFCCSEGFTDLDRGLVIPFNSSSGVRDTFVHLVCFIKSISG
jgi:hypothetical protein